MANNWREILNTLKQEQQKSIPLYLQLLNKQGTKARETIKKGLAQRGLLGTPYGQSALASQQASQANQLAQYLNQLQQQQTARELQTARFLAQLEQAEKARQFQEELAKQRLAWQKEMFKESQPKWYDYLLQGLGTTAGVASKFIIPTPV